MAHPKTRATGKAKEIRQRSKDLREYKERPYTKQMAAADAARVTNARRRWTSAGH